LYECGSFLELVWGLDVGATLRDESNWGTAGKKDTLYKDQAASIPK
jgi:hypothetical protein